jgi:hypothetical protein
MIGRRAASRLGWVSALLVAGALSGCTSTGEPPGSLLGPTPTLNTPSPSPSSTAPAAPADVSLLTGLPGATTRPAVVVPIRIAAGAPRAVGLDQADIVSMEFAESGSVRVAGVFASESSDRVGPLTMVRPSDAKIFSQTDPVFTEAGSPAGFVATVTGDHLALVSAKQGRAGFTASGKTYYVDTARVAAGTSTQLTTAMFQYAAGGQSVATSGVTTVTRLSVRVPGHTAVTWTYGATDRLWSASLFGTSMTATNLVVLTVPYITKSVSALHATVTFANPLGQGASRIVAGNQSVGGTWSKRNFNSALNLLGTDGRVPTLAPGRTWIVMVPAGSVVAAS